MKVLNCLVAFYPLWPSEIVNALDAAVDDTEIARRSVALYVGRGGIGKRPVLEYSAAVRAGAQNISHAN